MRIEICQNEKELGIRAAKKGAEILRKAAEVKDRITAILPTGASQFTMFSQLVGEPGIPWERVDVFHLDEYVGISPDHPASFRRYLLDRLVARVPRLGSFQAIAGDAANLAAEISRLNGLLCERDIDICFAGIGENGHLAFNDPPADFETTDPYIQVNLDVVCRQQQVNEGWFASLDDVPASAVTMSIRQIMKSDHLIITVPEARKARAVKSSVESPVSPQFPASILQQHDNCFLLLDPDSAGLLQTRD